jgi:hypothetical protein
MRKTCFLAVLLLVAVASHAKMQHFSGEAIVRTISENRVAVFLDTNGDQSIDKGFLLMMDVPMHNGYLAHFASAKVDFTDGYVRVTSDKNLVDLQVAGYPDPPNAPKDSDVVTLIGSALTHSNGDSGCDITHAQSKDASACFAYGK